MLSLPRKTGQSRYIIYDKFIHTPDVIMEYVLYTTKPKAETITKVTRTVQLVESNQVQVRTSNTPYRSQDLSNHSWVSHERT